MTSFMSVWVEEQYNGWIMMVVGVGLGLGFDMGDKRICGLGCVALVGWEVKWI